MQLQELVNHWVGWALAGFITTALTMQLNPAVMFGEVVSQLPLNVIGVRKDQRDRKGGLMLIKSEMYHGHEANPPMFWKGQ